MISQKEEIFAEHNKKKYMYVYFYFYSTKMIFLNVITEREMQ